MGKRLTSGDRIGKYRIIELIGEGGMGTVYRAQQLSMHREVALKVLSFKKEKIDPMLRKRFINEARTAGKLNHENIIHVFDVAKHGDTFYFSMELIDGDTVGDLLKSRERFDAVTSLTIAKGVLNALTAAGKLGIIHRDIKPDNIIITRGGIIKVSDLGLAKRADIDKGGSITQEGVVMGTPHYMSPEQARGENLDRRSDIYSLGATLFHMLTGRTPFTGKSSYAIIAEVMRGDFPYPSDVEPSIPIHVSDMVEKMMAHSPDERYDSAEDVLRDIERIENKATDQTMIGDIPAAEKKKVAWWWGIIAGTVILGAVLPLIVIFSADNNESPAENSTGNTQHADTQEDNGRATDETGIKKQVPDQDPSKEIPFMYGTVEKEKSGHVSVFYDFSYSSQLDDWFRDTYWRRKILRSKAWKLMTEIKGIEDSARIGLLRKYRLQYLRTPHRWHTIDGTLVNNSSRETEGFVNKCTWVDDVTCEITVEMKRVRHPSIICSFMNDQAGTGLSFNIGRLTSQEKNLFIVSSRGDRKKTEPIPVPFALETGVAYTLRLQKEKESVRFWCGKGTAIQDSRPVFQTRVHGYRSGNIALWSSRGFYKFYRVHIRGRLLELNAQGWYAHAGQWLPSDKGYAVRGYRDTCAVLRYAGLTPGKHFQLTAAGHKEFSADEYMFFSMPIGSAEGLFSASLVFGVQGSRIVASTLLSPLTEEILRAKTLRDRGRFGREKRGKGKNKPQLNRMSDIPKQTVIKAARIPDTSEITLSVSFLKDGILMNVNGKRFYKDIRHIEKTGNSIEVRANTKAFVTDLTAAALSDI